MSKATLLVVDDDKNTRDGIARALRAHYQVLPGEDTESALRLLAENHVDVMLTDLRMPGRDGLSLLKEVVRLYPALPVILLTAYGSVETAVAAMKEGAYDFLMKPINLDHLDLIVSRALRHREVERQNQTLKARLDSKFGMENIIGTSDAMKKVFDIIRQAAPTQATVLIQGPSGTGKELVAQAIHQLSPRATGPFVAVHCAALSSTLLESELFGHEKGAFTGAVSERKGRFELASGGTLFLDEISEIDLATQVKLLRALETRVIERVGGSKPIHVDIRLIAATNRDLAAYVREGKFREDLYFRLNVVDLILPPLAERKGDLPLLCDRFIREFAGQNGKPIDGITPDALSILQSYSWPGNVRELRNTIEKMIVLTRGATLTADDVPEGIRLNAQPILLASASAPAAVFPPPAPVSMPVSLDEIERTRILDVLRENKDNKSKAAQLLGISRRTLYRKLDEYRKLGFYTEEP